MSAAATVRRLDVERVRAKIRQVRTALRESIDVLHELYMSEEWRVCGHPTWEAFCAAELPELEELRLIPERRQPIVAELAPRMSLRGAAALVGVAPNTIKADLRLLGVARAEKITSRDGSVRSSSAAAGAPRRRRTPLTDRVVALLASADPDGLTVRDIARELRTERHLIAPTLTRLEDAGRIVYRRPARRGGFGTYVGRIVP